MKYEEAVEKFSKAYKDRYTIEFPAIFSLCNFRGKSVLEIGATKEGYFGKKVKRIVKRYKPSYVSGKIPEKLAFADNSFDIVFSRWTTQNVNNLEIFIKEMCRVGKSVIIVLPSEQGDQTEMLTIRYKNKRKDRKLRIVKIRKWMKESRMKTVERKKLLRLVFPEKEALDIIHAMEFENTLNKKEKEKIGKFLLKRKKHDGIHFTQGAAFIFGYK